MTDVRFHPAAADEVEDAYLFYKEQEPRAAQRFTAEVERALSLIADAPGQWPKGPRDTHRFVLRRFPFTIYYWLRQDVVTIVAVAHQKRSPAYWHDRYT